MMTRIERDVVKNPYHDEKLFWPYHKVRADLILKGEIPPPSLVEIDPTDSGCNQACVFCCFGSGPHRKLISIDVEKLLRFVAETYEHGTYAYELVGGGEPTNHAHIADIVQGIAALAKPDRERPHIGMVTNGVRLERILEVADKLDFVRVSLDAPNAGTYRVLHGLSENSPHFERVLNNVQNLVRKIGTEKVRIGYLVVPPHNHTRKAILETAKIAHNLKVEHIAFRPAFSQIGTERQLWEEAADSILEAKSLYRNGFILGGSSGSWPNAIGNEKHPVGICRTRPMVLVVKADGTIPSCFLYRERTKERPSIGNIVDGFKEVWFSKLHQKSIRSFDRNTCPDVCKLYRTERALDSLEKNLPHRVPNDEELDNPHFI
jgi:MoaA/NifB/PqqE/SkfB family radical SAM enzyme